MGKWLIIVGIFFIVFGLLVMMKIPIPFGKLPGDISVQGKNFQFYFPIVSSIIISIILSLLLYLFSSR